MSSADRATCATICAVPALIASIIGAATWLMLSIIPCRIGVRPPTTSLATPLIASVTKPIALLSASMSGPKSGGATLTIVVDPPPPLGAGSVGTVGPSGEGGSVGATGPMGGMMGGGGNSGALVGSVGGVSGGATMMGGAPSSPGT